MDLNELIEDVQSSVREYILELMDENKDSDAIYLKRLANDSDRIFEIVDSTIPIYTGDLLEVASTDIWLATEEPSCGPAFDGTATPINIIAGNIYDALMEVANAEIEVYIEELDSDGKFDCGEQ